MTDQQLQQDTGPVGAATLEAARFEFDKNLEAKKLRLEEKKLRQARVDTMARLLGTVVVGILVTGGIQLYSMTSETAAKDRAQRADQAQVAIQLANARERSLSDLRAQMFNALLRNYFKGANDSERIAILELIALNFLDAVQIRPMLELLDTELQTAQRPKGNEKLRVELRRAARVIVRDQLEQIRGAKDGGVSRLKLAVGESASPECFHNLAIKLVSVIDMSKIKVQVNSMNGVLLEPTNLEDKLDVTYFDIPLCQGSCRWVLS